MIAKGRNKRTFSLGAQSAPRASNMNPHALSVLPTTDNIIFYFLVKRLGVLFAKISPYFGVFAHKTPVWGHFKLYSGYFSISP